MPSNPERQSAESVAACRWAKGRIADALNYVAMLEPDEKTYGRAAHEVLRVLGEPDMLRKLADEFEAARTDGRDDA